MTDLDRRTVVVSKIFKVTVDYAMSLDEMISAGKYDWVNDGITPERFPIQGENKVERELILAHLGYVASTADALEELDRRGLRPAKIEELLAFGAKFPEEQKKFPILALGSHWVNPHGRRRFVYLGWRDFERGLHLRWGGSSWGGVCRFLAVRKSA